MPSTSVPPPAIDALPRQASRDPDFWLLAVAVLTLFAAGIQLLIFPFGRGVAVDALLGRAIIEGKLPVRDAWSAAAPGIGLLHAGIQTTLGRSMMAFRAVETIMVISTVLAATRVTKRWMGLERIGLIGGALFALTYVQLEIQHTGQPEFFAGSLLMLALALCARETAPRSKWAVAVLLGCLLGTVTLLVPAFALAALVFPRLYTHGIGSAPQRRSREWLQMGCLVVGFVLPLAAVAIWLFVAGSGPIFIRDYLKPLSHLWFGSSVVTVLARTFNLALGAVLHQSALISAGLLATFTLGTIHEHEQAGRHPLISLSVILLLALALQATDTPGALSALLPLTCTLAGIGIYKAWRRVMHLGSTGIATYSVALLFLVQMCVPVQYPPGNFLKRSLIRLLYIAGQGPYRSREMLESELYSSAEYNLESSRRVAASLKARSITNGSVQIVGNEPQLAWMLPGLPRYRFLEPVPANWAAGAPDLTRRSALESAAMRPDIIAVSNSTSVADTPVQTNIPLPEDYAPIAAIDNWRTYQRIEKRPASTDDTEFCDPNSN